jgi:hypothetical protein
VRVDNSMAYTAQALSSVALSPVPNTTLMGTAISSTLPRTATLQTMAKQVLCLSGPRKAAL